MKMKTAEPTASVFKGNRGRIRFSKAPWYSEVRDRTVSVIGAGGIGSWLTHFLARAGGEVELWDGDRYDINNMGGQFAGAEYIGTNKAIAAKTLIAEMLGEDRVASQHKMFTSEAPIHPVTFACVDDMDVRKLVYESWLALGDEREIFIDGRMGAEQFELYAATKEKDSYMQNWFPPGEASKLPCAYRATSHIGSMLASVMFGVYTNYYSDNFVPDQCTFNTQLLMMEAQ